MATASMLPKISVITPTYNQAEFIEETLESIEAQSYPNLEHIVIDAMSTDATPKILARYADRLSMRVVRESDRGQSDGINKGVRLATGEITCWLNSDDRFRPNALMTIGEAFRDNPKAGVVFGRGTKVARDGREIYTVPFRPFNRRHLKTAYRVVQPAMFFRRDLYLEIGGLKEDLHYAMDWDLLIRLAAKCEVVAIEQTLADIRYYDDTKTSTGGWKRMREIAEIGRHHNGPLDFNFLSYHIRSAVGRLDSRLAEKVTDEVLRRLVFRSTPVMVQGWPRQFGSRAS